MFSAVRELKLEFEVRIYRVCESAFFIVGKRWETYSGSGESSVYLSMNWIRLHSIVLINARVTNLYVLNSHCILSE